jgi:hypothetical protein
MENGTIMSQQIREKHTRKQTGNTHFRQYLQQAIINIEYGKAAGVFSAYSG